MIVWCPCDGSWHSTYTFQIQIQIWYSPAPKRKGIEMWISLVLIRFVCLFVCLARWNFSRVYTIGQRDMRSTEYKWRIQNLPVGHQPLRGTNLLFDNFFSKTAILDKRGALATRAPQICQWILHKTVVVLSLCWLPTWRHVYT